MKRISSFGKRLRRLMEERGLSYERLGEILEMNPQTLNRYVLEQREPKASVAADIALLMRVDALWLQGYDVPRGSIRLPDGAIRPRRQYSLPILGVIRAGVPVLASEEIEGYEPADVSEPELHFYLRVGGDSMINAGIHSGDLVLIRQQDCAENGQIVACVVDEEDATLKRFRRQGDFVILQPENPAFEPRIIPVRDFNMGVARIVGVAVKLVRSL